MTLVCVFHGDIQEEDFHVCWNNSDTCLQPGARYHIDHSTALNCTSTGEIVIMNVTFNDSATYTCYAESRSIHYPHGGYQSTNLCKLMSFKQPIINIKFDILYLSDTRCS